MRHGIGRLRAGGGGVALPTTTAMEAWYRKGLGITSAASAVSNWANQAVSGAARDYAQATGAAQPALQGDGTILFNGTSHFLKSAAFAVAQPFTVYFRVKIVSTAGGTFHYLMDGNTNNSTDVFFNTGLYVPNMEAGAGGPAGPAVTQNVYSSLAIVYNGASSVIQTDASTGSVGNPGATGLTGLTLCAQGGGTTFFTNAQVAEQIVYSAAHDAATRASIIAYLNTLA